MKFLMCYDYGMGGFWWQVEAPSAAEVRRRFPTLRLFFDNPPAWWGGGERIDRVHEYKLGQPLDEYTGRLVADAAKHAAGSGDRRS